MDIKFGKLAIFDGSYMLHRALHIPELFNLSTTRGEGTGAVFSVIKMINKELRYCKNFYPVICFDGGLSKRRLELDSKYKRADERELDKQRRLLEIEPEDEYIIQYRSQRGILIETLRYFGIPCLKYPGWEGDDLMYILSKESQESIVLTDDRDLLQLVSSKCSVRRPMAEEVWDNNNFRKEFNLGEEYEFVMTKALLGDGSDNIPSSCKGVGKGTSLGMISIINKFRNGTNYDFTNYPRTEESMKKFCSESGINYRKAYLNFDEERYITNLGLVDLDLVNTEPDIYQIINSMNATISCCREESNYFKALEMMKRYEIKDISVDELINNVSNRRPSLNY